MWEDQGSPLPRGVDAHATSSVPAVQGMASRGDRLPFLSWSVPLTRTQAESRRPRQRGLPGVAPTVQQRGVPLCPGRGGQDCVTRQGTAASGRNLCVPTVARRARAKVPGLGTPAHSSGSREPARPGPGGLGEEDRVSQHVRGMQHFFITWRSLMWARFTHIFLGSPDRAWMGQCGGCKQRTTAMPAFPASEQGNILPTEWRPDHALPMLLCTTLLPKHVFF